MGEQEQDPARDTVKILLMTLTPSASCHLLGSSEISLTACGGLDVRVDIAVLPDRHEITRN